MRSKPPPSEFDAVRYAKEEISPLLFSLCELLTAEGAVDQQSFFQAILNGIDRADHPDQLADPFIQLSMSAFMDFIYSHDATVVLDLVLERAQGLSESLSNDPNEAH